MWLGTKFVKYHAKMDQQNYLKDCELTIQRVTNLHKIPVDKLNWEGGFDQELSLPLQQSPKYFQLKEKLESYTPSFLDKIFLASSRKIEDLTIELNIQENIDKQNYELWMKEYDLKKQIKELYNKQKWIGEIISAILDLSWAAEYIKEFSVDNPKILVFENKLQCEIFPKSISQLFPEKNNINTSWDIQSMQFKIKPEYLNNLNEEYLKSLLFLYYKLFVQLLPRFESYEFIFPWIDSSYFGTEKIQLWIIDISNFNDYSSKKLFDKIETA